jgi:hypothetical protein
LKKKQGCLEYGKYLQSTKETFGSLNLTFKSIISRLKQKYSVDSNNNEENCNGEYIKLLYLKEINAKFIQFQQEYEKFKLNFF